MLLSPSLVISVLLTSSLHLVSAERKINFDLWADSDSHGTHRQIDVELGRCVAIPIPNIFGDPGSTLVR